MRNLYIIQIMPEVRLNSFEHIRYLRRILHSGLYSFQCPERMFGFGPDPVIGICFCVSYNRLPVNPEAEVAEGSVTLDQVKLIDYDHVWAGQNKDDMIKAWRDRIGK